MPIVIVCNATYEIIWTDSKLCTVVDCVRRPTTAASLFDFLAVPGGASLRADIEALDDTTNHLRWTTYLPKHGGGEIELTFFIERIPSFDGLDGAALISVGVEGETVQPDGHVADNEHGHARASQLDPLRQAYRYSNLRLDDGTRLFSRLERIVAAEGLFRDRSFTLEKAAARLDTNVLYISQITNFFSGQSFPNYLNVKRFEALEAALLKDTAVDFTEAWQAAGFGSYSSLNRFLRNVRGTSPSRFLKEVRKKGDNRSVS